MFFDDYMREKFPNLILRPPLFYHWDIGIRFELGNPREEDEGIYMEQVYQRSLALFKRLHLLEDNMMIVANVHHAGEENILKRRRLKIFNHYLKRKNVLYRLQHKVIPYIFEDAYEVDQFETHRYTLPCKLSDIKYIHLVKAICNHDMDLRPKIGHDVFFINLTKGTIFHIYDDRGCDVIASGKETIRHLYNEYDEWILDFDKTVITQRFL